MNNKYSAVLLGCAIGDALGMPVETWKREQIKKYVGRVETFIDPPSPKDENGQRIKEDEFGEFPEWFWTIKKGQFTDDTILTLAITESLVENNGIDYEDLAKKQAAAYFHYVALDENRGFGGTTKKAFENLKNGVQYLKSGAAPGTGNGPIMKTSPIAIYMDATNDYVGGMQAAETVARMTHENENAVVGALVQTDTVYKLLRNQFSNESELIENCLKLTKHKSKDSELEKKLVWIRENKDATVETAIEKLGVGCLAHESYSFTLFMFQKYWDNLYEGLIETVNCGGDCDTTGAMYGTLLGAKEGLGVFPDELIKNVERSEEILELGNKLGELK